MLYLAQSTKTVNIISASEIDLYLKKGFVVCKCVEIIDHNGTQTSKSYQETLEENQRLKEEIKALKSK